MVKFGERLDTAIYHPWKEFYLDYNKLKRIISRNKFILDRRKKSIGTRGRSGSMTSLHMNVSSGGLSLIGDIEMSSSINGGNNNADETTPLKKMMSMMTLSVIQELQSYETSETSEGSPVPIDDFEGILRTELDKINKFFVGKLYELRSVLEIIINKQSNIYRSHHSTSDFVTDIKNLRKVYIELTVFKSYVEFNLTGFRKITKKHDKVFKTCMQDSWMSLVNSQVIL